MAIWHRTARPDDDEGWSGNTIEVEGFDVFYRVSRDVPGALPIVHVHGFGISGAYLMPTARLLTDRATNLVPDLPGYGRSARRPATLGIPALAHALLELLDELELDRVVLVGNSMGCPVVLEVAHTAPDRVDRIVLASPAGGVQNQPLRRALRQLAVDASREPPGMARVAVPDYLRFGAVDAFHLFSEMTRFPSLERLLTSPVPALAVIGSLDPFMPPPVRVREVGRLALDHTTVALISGAAHSINFSHPGELAHVISSWLDGEEIVDDPDQPGYTRVVQLPRA